MARELVRCRCVGVLLAACTAGASAQTICGVWAYPPAPNNVVRAIVEFQGEAYIGGGFTNLGYMLTRWDGSSYVPLSQPLAWAGGGVSSLAVYDGFGGPALYVGGGSFQLSGVPFPTTHYGVVRWN